MSEAVQNRQYKDSLFNTVHPCTVLNDEFFVPKNSFLLRTTAIHGGI